MKKKNQSYQTEPDFDSFDPVSSSGTGSDFGVSTGPQNDFDDTSFGNEGGYKPPVRKNRSGNGSLLIAVAAVVLVLAIVAAAVLLRPKTVSQPARTGAAAPTGETAFLSPGCDLILNELLVTGDTGLSQKQIEEILAKLDGAVVGFLPELNQYQIRFNTNTQRALDEKKRALESYTGIIRADYNYLLAVSVTPEDIRAYDLPVLQAKTLGLLGGTAPDGEASAECFFLSSISSGTVSGEQLSAWLSDHKDSVLPEYRADQAAALLNQSAPQLFASCIFYETNQDGTIHGYTTTCALRFQLACLVNAGADTIAFPFAGPRIIGEVNLSAENELNELLFTALEKAHSSFILCKAWKENDFLISMFTGTETGKRHLITVSPFSGAPVAVLDAAHAGKQVYLSEAESAGADLAVYGNGAESSVVLAAAQLASIRAGRAGNDPAELKNDFLASCGVLVSQANGMVVPGFSPSVSGSASTGTLRLLKLKARDSRTGEDLSNVTYTADAGSGSVTEVSASGDTAVLLPEGAFSVAAKAEHYQNAATDRFPEKGNEAVVYLTGEQACGTIAGRINLSGSGIPENLSIRFRNTRTGAEYAAMPLSASYRREVNPGEYDLIVSGRNRTTVTVYGINVTAGQETAVPAFELSEVSDLPGTATGVIKDAMTGGPLEGVSMRFFEGVNAPETGHPVMTTVSDSQGQYSSKIPGGIYTAYLSKTGYRSDKMQIRVEGEKTIGDQNCTITPTMPEGSVRIVLDWGRHPDDLDSHLVNKTQDIHLYYSVIDTYKAKRPQTVTLDVDALGPYKADNSNRVETTTIHQQLPGKFTFYVHDFSNKTETDSRKMAESGAKVTVFIRDEKYVFDVPNKTGTLWEVFTLQNGVITPVGKVTNYPNASTVGQ